MDFSSTPGTIYRLQFADSLSSPSNWNALEDVYATESTSSVWLRRTNTNARFFRLKLPAYSGQPSVQIFSPANNATVSGVIQIGVGALIGTSLQGVNLYLDGALIDFIPSGGLEFELNTSHFPNGTHSLQVEAVSEANNKFQSSTVSLNFQNPVRWLEPETIFTGTVSIDVDSDIFPADWAIFVTDSNNEVVREYTGTTMSGALALTWDGKAENQIDVPVNAAYQVVVYVNPEPPETGEAPPSGQPPSPSSSMTIVSSGKNRYGSPQYIIEETLSAPPQTFGPTHDPNIEYPPLPFSGNQPPRNQRRVTSHEIFRIRQQTSVQALTESTGGSGSTSAWIWKESSWNSGQIVLARQKITGFVGITWNGVVANLLNNINNLVALAAEDLGTRRDSYQNSVFEMATAADYTALLGYLGSTSPEVTAFYFYGHGSVTGNAIGGGGLTSFEVFTRFGNGFTSMRGGKPGTINTPFPFLFIFLDGCMTGLGTFPEAFGIPKILRDPAFTPWRKKKRAFMGWGGLVSNSILDSDYMDWTLKFWNTWLAGPNYDTTLQAAVDLANTTYPDVAENTDTPLMIYGAQSLTWGE